MAAEPDHVQELVGILARLRAAGGCPWDREQTHRSLKRFLVEECGELLDAIDDDSDAGMLDELGDVLLQIVFHCQIAREGGRFALQDVARSECEKMIRRHPHVFGEAPIAHAHEVVGAWERIKHAERRGDDNGEAAHSAVDGVPRHLPALHRAQKMQQKAARSGFEWPDLAAAMAKVEEELGEVRAAIVAGNQDAVAEEIGDLLLAVVTLCRWQQVEAEDALQQAVRKFEQRFRAMEAAARREGRRLADCDATELLVRWRRDGCAP